MHWNWQAEENKESIVVKSVEAIAVYTNELGDIVIRQQNMMGDDDYFVSFPKSSINALIKALKAEAKR
jgi:hypothetical protein